MGAISCNLASSVDVRMIERGEKLRLSLEARHALGIARKLGGQDFQGDVPVEFCLMRALHLAHPAHIQQQENFVRAEFGSNG